MRRNPRGVAGIAAALRALHAALAPRLAAWEGEGEGEGAGALLAKP